MRLLPSLVLLWTGAAQVNFTYRDVGFDGGGWVTGLETHASTGIVYARTDVGGAYRSDDGGLTWQWLSVSTVAMRSEPMAKVIASFADPSTQPTGLLRNARLLLGDARHCRQPVGILWLHSPVYSWCRHSGAVLRHLQVHRLWRYVDSQACRRRC